METRPPLQGREGDPTVTPPPPSPTGQGAGLVKGGQGAGPVSSHTGNTYMLLSRTADDLKVKTAVMSSRDQAWRRQSSKSAVRPQTPPPPPHPSQTLAESQFDWTQTGFGDLFSSSAHLLCRKTPITQEQTLNCSRCLHWGGNSPRRRRNVRMIRGERGV